jgi:hypothetical protein
MRLKSKEARLSMERKLTLLVTTKSLETDVKD